MAEKYWHRICLMVITANITQWYTILMVIFVIGYQFFVNWPQLYFIYGIPTYLGLCFWCWKVIPHCFSIILVFHQMCYYLKLRFIHTNKLLENFSTKAPNKKIQQLIDILEEHDRICITVEQFNQFWCKTLFLDVFLYTSVVLLMTCLGFFSQLVLFLKLFFGSFTLVFVSCFCCTFLSAAVVSTEVKTIESL